MNMQEIKTRAKAVGIRPGKMRKAEVIRTIQRTEGNPDCYGIEWRFDCLQEDCCWRSDCLVRSPG